MELAERSNIRCRTQTSASTPNGVGHPEAAPIETGNVEADERSGGRGLRDAPEKHKQGEKPCHVGV